MFWYDKLRKNTFWGITILKKLSIILDRNDKIRVLLSILTNIRVWFAKKRCLTFLVYPRLDLSVQGK
jgi:hypothetical protein